MSYLSAGVVLLIVGVCVYLFTTVPSLGVLIGVIGAGLVLYALLANRRHT
jgi:hypothetical protein